MNETVVDTWEELQSALYDDSKNDNLGRYRSPYVFRGLSDAEYGLETSLTRLITDDDGQDLPKENYEALESHLLRNFSKYAHRDVPNQSVWHLLAVAQHHGLPTRLLDWTFSPLVAAHFATESTRQFDTPGMVWKVHHKRAHEQLPWELSHVLEQEQSAVFTVDMLEGATSSVRDLHEESEGTNTDEPSRYLNIFYKEDYLKKEKLAETISYPSVRDSLHDFDQLGDFVAFFEPPSLDERIVNQSALFSVMTDPTARLDEWLEDHPDLCEKIIIPAESKPKFRDYLDQANVTERVLFPGLDGLADWLTRYYTPKHKWESYTDDAN